MPPHLVCRLNNHQLVAVEPKPLAAQQSQSRQACLQCWQAHPPDCGPWYEARRSWAVKLGDGHRGTEGGGDGTVIISIGKVSMFSCPYGNVSGTSMCPAWMANLWVLV